MKSTASIALNVFRESVRDKVLYNLVAFAILLIGASYLIGQLTAAQDVKVIKDLGLAATSIFGLFIAVFIGIGLGWQFRNEMLEQAGTPVTFPRQAAFTHALYAADANRPVEIWANEEERMVRWLSKRLSFPLQAPNLNNVGFALVGGRLVAGNEKPGALFMYENANKQRISLFVRKDDERTRETAFRYAYEDGVGVFYWIDDACGYALSGKLERAQLLSIARLVYGQLAPPDAAAPK